MHSVRGRPRAVGGALARTQNAAPGIEFEFYGRTSQGSDFWFRGLGISSFRGLGFRVCGSGFGLWLVCGTLCVKSLWGYNPV